MCLRFLKYTIYDRYDIDFIIVAWFVGVQNFQNDFVDLLLLGSRSFFKLCIMFFPFFPLVLVPSRDLVC